MRHWIFDFDGTLFQTDHFIRDMLKHALEPFGVDASDDFLEETRAKHPHEIFDEILGKEKGAKALKLLQEKGKEIVDKVQPYPGIVDLLEELKAHAEKVYIWTGRDLGSARRILKSTNSEHYFDDVVTGTCVPRNKPEPDGLHKIAYHSGVSINQFIMVGDHHHDIQPAKKLGCTTIHAQWKSDPYTVDGSDHSFTKVSDLLAWYKSVR